MSQDLDKYQKIIRWLLENINPELHGIQQILNRLANHYGLNAPTPNKKSPENLIEVLEEVEDCERKAISFMLHINKTYEPPKKQPVLPIELNEKFEKLFPRVIPRIDYSFSVIETIVFGFNEKEVSIELEAIPPASNDQSNVQRQVRFIDKAKRIKHNLSLIEEYLIKYQKVQMEQSFNFVYTPPDWSVPPITNFSLEVRESNYILNTIPLIVKGHYLLGRFPACDIILEDVTCSRQHAVIQFRPGDFTDEVYIYDLKSTSGTYVNGMALQPLVYYPLLPGDSLQFGRHSSTFTLCHKNQRVTRLPSGKLKPTVHIVDVVTREITEGIDGYPPNSYLDLEYGGAKTPTRHSKRSLVSRLAATPHYTDPREFIKQQESGQETLATPNYLPRDRVQTHNLVSPSSKQPSIVHSDSFANTTQTPTRNFFNNKLRRKKDKSKKTPHLNPKVFNAEDYKRSMIEKYEKQKTENEANLKLKKERDAQGIPPIVELPYVPERPKMNTVAGRKERKKKWWCISRK